MNNHESVTFPCPVCGCLVFNEPPGSYEICGVCGWEDDGVQVRHPRMRGGANGGSIFDYQSERTTWDVSGEARDPDWRPLDEDEAPLPSRETGAVDYTLDYYHGREPYYWRYR